jgi:ferric-dicitrate binding protein FerR (iron transport regulator)
VRHLLPAALLWAALAESALPGQSSAVDPAVMKPFEAQATAVTGQVSRIRNNELWALSTGERVPVQQIITTGSDGYAHFDMAGGSNFDIFSNSRVIFRQNIANTGDLVDVLAGRVRVHMQPVAGQHQQRVFCPTAIISTHEPATLALAIDEDDTVRIDVMEGQVQIQHAFRPRSEPVLIRAIDAIVVQKNEPISRRIDRGTLYRYKVRILSALTFGHSGHDAEPIEGNKFLAQSQSLRVSF